MHGWAGADPQPSVSAEILLHLRADGDRQAWTRRWLTALAFLQSAAAQRAPVEAVKYAVLVNWVGKTTPGTSGTPAFSVANHAGSSTTTFSPDGR